MFYRNCRTAGYIFVHAFLFEHFLYGHFVYFFKGTFLNYQLCIMFSNAKKNLNIDQITRS